MSGTHRDLLFWSKSRCFASKNDRWGLELIEFSISDARHAVLHAQNHRWRLGPIETCNSDPNVTLLNAQNHRWGQKPIETSDSVANHAVVHAQNDRWGLVPIETCILVQKSLFCMHKTTDLGWNPYRLVILVQITLFSMHKSTGEVLRDLSFWSKRRCFARKNHWWGLGHIETSNSGANHAVLHTQNDRLCLGPIETCYSGPKVDVLHPKTTDEGGDLLRLVFVVLITLFCMHKTTGEFRHPWRLVILLQ